MLAIGAVLFASCSSNDDLFDPEKAAQRKEAQYTDAFVKQYGKIDPNQDWGFGEKAETRGANTNSNEWKNYVVVPESVIDTEEAKQAIEWFKANQNPQSISVNWSDFFVQQVYKGEAKYIAKNGGEVTGSNQMDWLVAWDGEKDDHISNFNNGNGTIMLMVNSSTARFGYHCSLGGPENGMQYKYCIQKIGEGYYVGFDFCAEGEGPNQQVDADGFYSDWIVKISPAVYITDDNTQRVIAEDLGVIGDFDFNDVVFDISSTGSGSEAKTIITLQAAGGTLPLYLNANGKEYEVHECFGVSTATMVNTVARNEKAPVTIEIPGVALTASEIDIIIGDPATGKRSLSAECGKAPGKICVKPNYDWTEEREGIGEKYKSFDKWVRGEISDDTWY